MTTGRISFDSVVVSDRVESLDVVRCCCPKPGHPQQFF